MDKALDNIRAPSLPVHVAECLFLIDDPDVNLDIFLTYVNKDPGLAASVLKLANSSLYSAFKPTSDLRKALTRIGIYQFSHILVGHFLEDQFKFSEKGYFNIDLFLKHSISVSQIAFELAKAAKVKDQNDLFISGLFHDIGHLFRIVMNQDEMESLINKTVSEECDFSTAEKLLNLQDHGSYAVPILEKWKLSQEIIFLISNHHNTETDEANSFNPEQTRKLKILSIADKASLKLSGKTNYKRNTQVNPMDLDLLGVSKTTFQTICLDVKNNILSPKV